MGLADIAAGIEVTDHQDEQGVATVDDTDATLAERLAPFEAELPCSADDAGTILERYAGGGSVGDAGRAAGVAPITAAKTLYLLGESVSPATPLQQEILADWHRGDLSRTEAIELTGLTETEFALAGYVETHEPLEAACAEIEGVLAAQSLATTDPLADAVGDDRHVG
jgi:hypothetical protein